MHVDGLITKQEKFVLLRGVKPTQAITLTRFVIHVHHTAKVEILKDF